MKRKPAYISSQPRRCEGGEPGERGACLACGALAAQHCQRPGAATPRPKPPKHDVREELASTVRFAVDVAEPAPEAVAEASEEPREPGAIGVVASGQLKSIIERVERLEAEKAEIGGAIKEVYAEAKGNGFDAKILRKVVRIRKQDRAKRLEEEAILDLYLVALGDA